MEVVWWCFCGVIFTALVVWFIKRARWVRQLRRDTMGPHDSLDLWLEVLVNGKP